MRWRDGVGDTLLRVRRSAPVAAAGPWSPLYDEQAITRLGIIRLAQEASHFVRPWTYSSRTGAFAASVCAMISAISIVVLIVRCLPPRGAALYLSIALSLRQ